MADHELVDRIPALITKAVRARDREALMVVTRQAVEAARVPRGMVTTSPFTPTQLGAALLTGAATRWAANLRSHLCTYIGKEQKLTPVASIAPDEMPIMAVYKMFDIALLSGELRPLPAGKGKPSAWMRPALNRQRKLLAAYTKRDPKALGTAIASFGRADPAKWSLLAYAMYRTARGQGIEVKVPRKYDF